jgi:nucleoside 2-deoxyribosyltransferase
MSNPDINMHRKKVVYVAGPFRAPTGWGVECNCRKAESLALECWRLGVTVICPHKNTQFFDGAADDSIWLEGDLELLRRSDAVILVEGWENSSSSCAEVIHAIDERIPVFTTVNGLAIWMYHETVTEVQSEIKAKAIQSRDARRAKAGA